MDRRASGLGRVSWSVRGRGMFCEKGRGVRMVPGTVLRTYIQVPVGTTLSFIIHLFIDIIIFQFHSTLIPSGFHFFH